MIEVSKVRFSEASPDDRDSGLLGYVGFVLNDYLALDGITLRRSAKGELYLSFPVRRDRRGGSHPIIRPLGSEVREAIEGQVLSAIWALGGAA